MYYKRIDGIHSMPTCDDCAETVVPFKLDSCGIYVQSRPWCWSNFESGQCHRCERVISFVRNLSSFDFDECDILFREAGLAGCNYKSTENGLYASSVQFIGSVPVMTLEYVSWSKCLSITKKE